MKPTLSGQFTSALINIKDENYTSRLQDELQFVPYQEEWDQKLIASKGKEKLYVSDWSPLLAVAVVSLNEDCIALVLERYSSQLADDKDKLVSRALRSLEQLRNILSTKNESGFEFEEEARPMLHKLITDSNNEECEILINKIKIKILHRAEIVFTHDEIHHSYNAGEKRDVERLLMKSIAACNSPKEINDLYEENFNKSFLRQHRHLLFASKVYPNSEINFLEELQKRALAVIPHSSIKADWDKEQKTDIDDSKSSSSKPHAEEKLIAEYFLALPLFSLMHYRSGVKTTNIRATIEDIVINNIHSIEELIDFYKDSGYIAGHDEKGKQAPYSPQEIRFIQAVQQRGLAILQENDQSKEHLSLLCKTLSESNVFSPIHFQQGVDLAYLTKLQEFIKENIKDSDPNIIILPRPS